VEKRLIRSGVGFLRRSARSGMACAQNDIVYIGPDSLNSTFRLLSSSVCRLTANPESFLQRPAKFSEGNG
jgi:hypothetical protein